MFTNYYQNNVLPLYGQPRDSTHDHMLLEENTFSHRYSVEERVDFTHLPVYSIDPEGCEDADDAFSVFFKSVSSEKKSENLKTYLAIHIADPTEFIELNLSLWENILERAVTRYPSQIRPIHLMPQPIVDRASLMENHYGTEKYAISIVTEISPNTFLPINNVEILFTKIRVSKRNNYSYTRAANLVQNSSMVLNTGIKIAEALFNSRNTVGKKLNQEILSRVKYDSSNKFYFVKDSSEIVQMKHMIEEFAIFANSVVGNYLTHKMNGLGIFRTCESKAWLDTLDANISGAELMEQIIDNGISANYLAQVLSHDLVGVPEYCHFTSPIRRVTDCVCHYLLKYIHLKDHREPNFPVPFSQKKLDAIAKHSQSVSKKMKKIQFQDFKYQNLETLARLCQLKPVNISIRFTRYTGLFANFLITQIDGHKVSVSYVLRIKNYQYVDFWNNHPQLSFDITHVNIPGKFDEGTLPEMDAIIKTPVTIESSLSIDK